MTILDAFKDICKGKLCGVDNISAEHFDYANIFNVLHFFTYMFTR